MTDPPTKHLVMEPPIKMTREVSFEMTVKDIAEAWCAMSDDGQAQFFVEVAKIMQGWDGRGQMQSLYIGHHLRDCPCITDEAREVVSDIYHFMCDPKEEAGS